VIGSWLVHLLAHREEAAAMIADLFGAVAAGELEVTIGGVYPLSEAQRAHEDLAGRRTSGKLLLNPSE
jgi:NADPH2:quinone reductase